MRNLIRAEILPTKFCPEPHLVITVDGVPLDELVATATGTDDFRGLIPAWLGDLADPLERKVVWDRIEQPNDTRSIVPVLMCSDDLDLWCTVVLADTSFAGDIVTWHALGIDTGQPDGMPDSIGSDVSWFADVGPFQFSREDYAACVAAFRNDLEVVEPADGS